MKLKEMWKRFWTLDVHNHAGFTLVELIIVIAILAILSTGAIAGYSAYIESANKTADQAMIAEIKNVLMLKAYSEGVSNADFVILTLDGEAQVGVEGGFAEKALEEAYGSNWASALQLKSNDWLAGAFLVNLDDAALIANSTFLTTATPDGLMSAVTNLTGAASTVISGYGGDVAAKLESLGMGDVAAKLEATGLEAGTEEYNTAVSNLLVSQFAGAMNGLTVEEAMNDSLAGTALLYASLYAYCESEGDTTTMDTVNEYLASQDDMDNLTTNSFFNYISTLDSDFVAGYDDYMTNGNGNSDMEATLKIMGAVSNISSGYTSASDLSNSNLYASDAVSSQLNDYVSAIKAVAGMDANAVAALKSLDPNEVAVVITVALDGTVA